MAEIFDLQGRKGARNPPSPQKTGQAQEDAERIARERYKAIQEKIKKLTMIRTKTERLRVANNLWRILEEGEKAGVSKREVLHAADMGSHTDSTKRLPYFAIDPDLSKEEQQRRAGILTKHIAKYVKIVSASAERAGKDVQGLIERLVEGTTYAWSPGDADDSGEDLGSEGWDKLADAVQLVGQGIANRHDLRRFFERVDDLGIRVDLEGGLTPLLGRSEKYFVFQEKASPALIETQMLPPRPSVYLGEISAGKSVHCTIDLPIETHPKGFGPKGALFEECLKTAGLLDFVIRCAAMPALKAWLELLPLGRGKTVTPVLRVTSFYRVTAAEYFDRFAAFGGETFYEGFQIFDGEGPLQDQTTEYGISVCGASDEGSNSGFDYCGGEAKYALDSTYKKSIHAQVPYGHSLIGRFDDWARRLLIKKALHDNTVPMVFRRFCDDCAAAMADLGLDPPDDGLWPLLGDTMAGMLECSLFNAPEVASLGGLLEERSKALVSKLDLEIRRTREQHEAQLERLRSEYGGAESRTRPTSDPAG